MIFQVFLQIQTVTLRSPDTALFSVQCILLIVQTELSTGCEKTELKSLLG